MSAVGNVHGTGLVLGGTGLMLRGPSGSGKSILALALIDEWDARGLKARLVADDRLDLAIERGALVMHAPKAIAGLIELRGRGIVKRPHVERAKVDLVVDLVPELMRLVEEDALVTDIMGVSVARCPVPQAGVVDYRHQALLVREAIREIEAGRLRARQKTT